MYITIPSNGHTVVVPLEIAFGQRRTRLYQSIRNTKRAINADSFSWS